MDNFKSKYKSYMIGSQMGQAPPAPKKEEKKDDLPKFSIDEKFDDEFFDDEEEEKEDDPGEQPEYDEDYDDFDEDYEDHFDNEPEGDEIIPYLLYICGFLLDSDWYSLEHDEILEVLDSIFRELEEMRTYYEKPAPLGANALREIMLEILTNIMEGADNLKVHLTEDAPDLMETGVEKIEQADQMIDSLHELIAQQRLELAELKSKLEKGESIEKDDSIYISDVDIK